MNWTYLGNEVTGHADLESECSDIVYELEFTDGTKYIGKKVVRSMRRLKPTKKQLAIRKNYVRKELKDIPFIKYEGSSSENDGKIVKSKKILYQCRTKKAATYTETALLFKKDAILVPEYNNKNIGGHYFDNDLDGLLGGDHD